MIMALTLSISLLIGACDSGSPYPGSKKQVTIPEIPGSKLKDGGKAAPPKKDGAPDDSKVTPVPPVTAASSIETRLQSLEGFRRQYEKCLEGLCNKKVAKKTTKRTRRPCLAETAPPPAADTVSDPCDGTSGCTVISISASGLVKTCGCTGYIAKQFGYYGTPCPIQNIRISTSGTFRLNTRSYANGCYLMNLVRGGSWLTVTAMSQKRSGNVCTARDDGALADKVFRGYALRPCSTGRSSASEVAANLR